MELLASNWLFQAYLFLNQCRIQAVVVWYAAVLCQKYKANAVPRFNWKQRPKPYNASSSYKSNEIDKRIVKQRIKENQNGRRLYKRVCRAVQSRWKAPVLIGFVMFYPHHHSSKHHNKNRSINDLGLWPMTIQLETFALTLRACCQYDSIVYNKLWPGIKAQLLWWMFFSQLLLIRC